MAFLIIADRNYWWYYVVHSSLRLGFPNLFYSNPVDILIWSTRIFLSYILSLNYWKHVNLFINFHFLYNIIWHTNLIGTKGMTGFSATLLAVIGVLRQSIKSFWTISNRSKLHKFKMWFQLAFAVADSCGMIIFFYFKKQYKCKKIKLLIKNFKLEL